MHFDISMFKNVSIQSFDLEEMSGQDSLDAAARVIGPRSRDRAEEQIMGAREFNIAHRNNLISQAITKVNGKPVMSPHTEWSNWSLRTQEFVISAYSKLNEAEAREISDFIKAHFDSPNGASAPTSSGSSSTSLGISEAPTSHHKAG